jgi:hypothetical protein
MKKLSYRHFFYSIVVIVVCIFFFIDNDWTKRMAIVALAIILGIVVKFAPKKYAGILVILAFLVFKLIDEMYISN